MEMNTFVARKMKCMKTKVLNNNMQVISEVKFPDKKRYHVSSVRIGDTSRDTFKSGAKVINMDEL